MIHDQYKVIQVRLDLRLRMEILIYNDIYKNLEEKKKDCNVYMLSLSGRYHQ